MIGKRYWSTGISLRYSNDRGAAWSGSLDFFDDGFANDDLAADRISTQGQLRTRYFVHVPGQHSEVVAAVTDTLRRDAETLGIEFRDPYLYAEGDGEDPNNPLPDGWVDMFEEQADQLGWGMPAYREQRP
jgi:hypothetical protein